MSTVKPILRIFDYDKTLEFYINWLGFKIDWEHVFEPGAPRYIQVTFRDISFHLSEHHGDSSPGAHIFIEDFTGHCIGTVTISTTLLFRGEGLTTISSSNGKR